MVLDEDEESEESEENTDVDTNPYPTLRVEKANNDDDLTPEEVIALILTLKDLHFIAAAARERTK